jgi:hypothetical protein
MLSTILSRKLVGTGQTDSVAANKYMRALINISWIGLWFSSPLIAAWWGVNLSGRGPM